ncbi:MAG: hypothetical protein KKD44_07790 [Proteobacteria bacterium]|nr:hypothetical protein [Pseudomonadota bacterium]
MATATKEEMDILIKLQDIETRAYKINKILDGVEQEIETRRKKRSDAENGLAKLESELETTRSQYKEFESEVRDRDIRLKKSEEYLKNVKTNNEYQTLLREIDDNKKRNSEVETQMIEFLERIETKEKEIREIKSRCEDIVRDTEREIAEIESTTITERKELEEILEKRDAVATLVKPRLLDMFNRILKQSAGLAIVPMTNSTCNGCFMKVPPQKFIEIQRGESLNFCHQCHRILYYKGN